MTSAAATGTSDGQPPARYTGALAGRLESRWQAWWAEHDTYRTPDVTAAAPFEGAGTREGGAASPVAAEPAAAEPAAAGPGSGARKRFVMDMFPYPSGAGLHVGHPLGYIATDVHARYLRMAGDDVLYTMGFDAFGLPAEQYAVQTGAHPRATTEANIAEFIRQFRRIGLSHDESRRIATIDPGFVRWTQWQFVQIYQSWFDPEAAGGAGAARPISELAARFADGSRPVPGGVDGVPAGTLASLSAAQRTAVLDGFRLAYADTAPVNWCPGLGTVLANEEVTADGRSERGNFPVFIRDLRQWKMRITAYAERLLGDLDRVDWPESVKTMQRNWIGRSTGARIRFGVSPDQGDPPEPVHLVALWLDVYTTRPDTLFGATFMVVNPTHPLLSYAADSWPAGTDPRWTAGAATPKAAVAAYRATGATRSARESDADRPKTGVYTGLSAVNPVDGRSLPVFVADYVLAGYGTGAIMAVPGQDERDFSFAEAFGLPVIRTVAPPADFPGGAWTGGGAAINSANDTLDLNGLEVAEAKAAMITWLSARGLGEPVVQYRLRDWLFSRQRYWGEPFPILYDADGVAHAVPDDQLPVLLPEVADYSPATFDPDDASSNPQPPLGKATDWVSVSTDLGEGAGVQTYRRETSTMPNWAGSCWYELRYLSPHDDKEFVDPAAERYWMGPGRGAGAGVPADPGGVDLYVGGVEHAVLHLLYSRFWHKVLFDLGLVSSEEPFRRLINQGYIQAWAYTDARGFYVPAEEVEEHGEQFSFHGEPVTREYGKMGKSLRNIVTPDQMCDRYGADTFRLYEMSMGPLADSRPWSTRDVIGSHRFLQRLWRLMVSEETGALAVTDDEPGEDAVRLLHVTIAGVGADFGALRHNTAAAKLIELVNHLTKVYAGRPIPRAVAEPLVLLVAPLCPHIAEELWELLGKEPSVTRAPFPVAEARWLVQDTVEYPIQVSGKVRAHITVAADADRESVTAAALAEARIAELLGGVPPKRVVVVPGRLVNIVA